MTCQGWRGASLGAMRRVDTNRGTFRDLIRGAYRYGGERSGQSHSLRVWIGGAWQGYWGGAGKCGEGEISATLARLEDQLDAMQARRFVREHCAGSFGARGKPRIGNPRPIAKRRTVEMPITDFRLNTRKPKRREKYGKPNLRPGKGSQSGLDLIQDAARLGATRRGAARGYKSRNVPRFDTRRVERITQIGAYRYGGDKLGQSQNGGSWECQ